MWDAGCGAEVVSAVFICWKVDASEEGEGEGMMGEGR